jgi:hypothetical protein
VEPTAPPPTPTPLPPARPEPQRCGVWVSQLPIAFGGNAFTWLAEGPAGSAVVKIARTPAGRASLAREIDLLGRAAHPHLIRMLDHAEDHRWMVVERVDGESWHRWAEDRPVADVVGVALEVAHALSALHALRVAHLDLRPANVLVDAWGHAKLIDLGAATPFGERLTLGATAGFVAPELLSGGKVSAASDVYGLGASLYAALTSQAPWPQTEPAAMLHAASTATPLPPSAWRVGIPERLERLILAMLARDPMDRPELIHVVRDLLKLPARANTGCARPAIGMIRARLLIHREIGRAATGRPAVIVIHGPPGSGRRTLASQAMRIAQREKMQVLDRAEVAAVLDAHAADARPAAVLRARKDGVLDLARRVLRGRGAALLVLWDARPVPELAELGAIHVSPDPLDLDQIAALADWCGVPVVAAHEVWTQSQGLPAAVWTGLHRVHGGAALLVMPAIYTSAAGRLSVPARIPPERAPPEPGKEASLVLAALRANPGAHSVLALARALKLHPASLLDECVALEAAGWVTFSSDGDTVRLAPGAT